MGYLFIFGTIIFTVMGQILIKWRVTVLADVTSSLTEKVMLLVKLCTDPLIILAFLLAFVAALFWLLAMTRFPISYAYPFTSLSFILVLLLGNILFQEVIKTNQIFGVLIICFGVFLAAR